MPIEVNTKVTVAESYGRGLGNLFLEDASFFGRPNFSGETDRFGDDRRKFTVLIPNDVADQLREIGWNVKTTIPTQEQAEEGLEPLSHMKVMVDDISKIHIKQGETIEELNSKTFGMVDRTRFEEIGMEIRAWEFNPKEKPGQYSARLVQMVGVMRPNLLASKYGVH